MNIVVFEDAGAANLLPITTGRPAYAITCACYRLIDWLPNLDGHLLGMVRPHLEAVQLMDYPVFNPTLDLTKPWTLVVNARMVPSVSNIRLLRNFMTEDESPAGCVARVGISIAAAIIPTEALKGKNPDQWLVAIEDYANGAIDKVDFVDPGFRMFEYPHDVVRYNMECFNENVRHKINNGQYREVADDVFVAPGAHISDFVVTNSKAGPIVIDADSVIGPFCYLSGPIHVGPNCRVNEHSAIKDMVSLSHTIKLGGEIEATVIEPYSNKQHHGFLGHSYLGSWINLGAGTCNSDLKNTYGEVNMIYDSKKVATGMQFIGCIMGDYAKTAINTSIFTGKTIGSCSMLYGFVTTNVPSYVNYARSFGQVTELPPAVMESTQRRMFGRRNVEQRPCDVQLIHDMYHLTANERQLSEEPIAF